MGSLASLLLQQNCVPQNPAQAMAVEHLPQKLRRKDWHGVSHPHSCEMKSVGWDNDLHIL